MSTWKIDIDPESNRFDLKTITDVILHVRYTAREGGEALAAAAKNSLVNPAMLYARMFSAKHEYSNEFHRFVNPAEDASSHELLFEISNRFPYYAGRKVNITALDLYILTNKTSVASKFNVKLFKAPADLSVAMPQDPFQQSEMSPDGLISSAYHCSVNLDASEEPGRWQISINKAAANAADKAVIPDEIQKETEIDGVRKKRLDPDLIANVVLICHYKVVS